MNRKVNEDDMRSLLSLSLRRAALGTLEKYEINVDKYAKSARFCEIFFSFRMKVHKNGNDIKLFFFSASFLCSRV